MSEIKQRLQTGAAILEQLKRKRLETRTPQCGYDIEFLIVYRELQELENDLLAEPGPGSPQLDPLVRKLLADGGAPNVG